MWSGWLEMSVVLFLLFVSYPACGLNIIFSLMRFCFERKSSWFASLHFSLFNVLDRFVWSFLLLTSRLCLCIVTWFRCLNFILKGHCYLFHFLSNWNASYRYSINLDACPFVTGDWLLLEIAQGSVPHLVRFKCQMRTCGTLTEQPIWVCLGGVVVEGYVP